MKSLPAIALFQTHRNKAERRDALFPCPPPGPACPQASSSIHTETPTHTPNTFHLHLAMPRFDANALLRSHEFLVRSKSAAKLRGIGQGVVKAKCKGTAGDGARALLPWTAGPGAQRTLVPSTSSRKLHRPSSTNLTNTCVGHRGDCRGEQPGALRRPITVQVVCPLAWGCARCPCCTSAAP